MMKLGFLSLVGATLFLAVPAFGQTPSPTCNCFDNSWARDLRDRARVARIDAQRARADHARIVLRDRMDAARERQRIAVRVRTETLRARAEVRREMERERRDMQRERERERREILRDNFRNHWRYRMF